MQTVRWKRLLIADNAGQLQRLTLQLEANDIRYAVGSHRPWKAVATEPWLMVPAADLPRATALAELRPELDNNLPCWTARCPLF